MDQYCETKFICTHKFSNSFVSGAKFGLTLWRDLVVSLQQKVHSHTRSISSAKDLQYWWSFALLSIYLSLPFSFFWLPLLVCSPSASATYLPTYLWPPSFSYILIWFDGDGSKLRKKIFLLWISSFIWFFCCSCSSTNDFGSNTFFESHFCFHYF